ncbi:MAG: CDP-diacylglycerol--glycerol-3-phosphate 3-phosphatidyltransferase [Planctomycetota bacterium]
MLPRRHVPNAITIARLALTAACIACLSRVNLWIDDWAEWDSGPTNVPKWLSNLSLDRQPETTALIAASLALFVIAACTDWLDGYLARRWRVISQFGRVMDPLADKVLILGVFTVLAGSNFTSMIVIWHPGRTESGVATWMVVLMLTRELLVTGLRSVMESSGTAFGAVTIGKLKMVLQSVTIPVILIVVVLGPYEPGHGWMHISRDVLIYATVLVTVLSAWPYVAAAMRAKTQHNPEPRQVTPDR